VLDCHSASRVARGRTQQLDSPRGVVPLPYVTAGLDLRYLRPSPLGETVELRGVAVSANESEIVADVELLWEGKTRAAASARWKRWLPR
jgi:acyl-coenzyme A thioesterase PaaI-like protein